LTADLKTRLSRVGTRGADASDANARVVREQESYDLGRIHWTLLDASGSPDETLRSARKVVEE
jgi:dephospho-CoA kinase